MWLTRFVGSGSTGNVWQCQFDSNDDLFAIKIAEQRRSDPDSRQRLRNEFGVYLSLEEAYKSGNYPIASLRTAMGRLRVMPWTFSSLSYATAY